MFFSGAPFSFFKVDVHSPFSKSSAGVSRLHFQALGFKVLGLGFRVKGLGFRV